MSSLLSVVIPSYNTKETLIEQCVKSIVSEMVDGIEVIIVDDGSKEQYAIFLDKIASIYSNVRVVHQLNRGEGGARNRGIIESSGKYVMFIDADDAVGKGWIETALELAEKYNADIVAGKLFICSTIPQNNIDKIDYDFKVFSGDDVSTIQQQQLFERSDVLPNIGYIDMGVCSKLFRKSLIENIRFPEGVVLSADQVYNHMTIKLCNTFVLTNKLSYYYITNPDSISHVYHSDAVEVMMHSMELVKQNLIDNKDVLDAYYYHCIRDLQRGIQFACFNCPVKQSFSWKVSFVKNAFSSDLAVEARHGLNLNSIKNTKTKLSCAFVKYNKPFLYVLYCNLVYFAKKIIK